MRTGWLLRGEVTAERQWTAAGSDKHQTTADLGHRSLAIHRKTAENVRRSKNHLFDRRLWQKKAGINGFLRSDCLTEATSGVTSKHHSYACSGRTTMVDINKGKALSQKTANQPIAWLRNGKDQGFLVHLFVRKARPLWRANSAIQRVKTFATVDPRFSSGTAKAVKP
jgi:hypothetical protein